MVKQTKAHLQMNGFNTFWHIHSIEYYSATKGNTLLRPETTWLNLRRHCVEQKKSQVLLVKPLVTGKTKHFP